MHVSLVLFVLAGCGSLDPIVKDKDTEPVDESDASLVLGKDAIDFGDVAFGDLESNTLSMSNPGSFALVLTTITAESPYRVSHATLQLPPGGSDVITVFVQPNGYGTFASELTIVTDSDAVGVVSVPLTVHTIADVDGDGFDTVDAVGGTDCDDTNPAVHPGAVDEWYDGVDHDCDGASEYDRDGDGYEAETDDHDVFPGMADCNDGDATFYPGAPDVPYDNKDTNCDDSNDYDYDGDGYESLAYGRGSDCDDADPAVNRDGTERFNGKDDDCNGSSDDDAKAEDSAYVYDHSGGNFERAGYATAVGDLDGDGIAEVIVAAPYLGATTGAGSGRGGVAVFRGPALLASGSDIDDADNWFEGTGTSDLLGAYVTVMGDYDGDGVDELAIGATGTSSGAGTVYILGGEDARSGGDTSDAIATYTGLSGAAFGRGLGTDVDLNADGFDELVVMYASGSANAVAVEYGSGAPASGSVSTMDASWSTDGTEAAFYRNAPVGGDLDGDGYEDLVLSDGMADYAGVSDSGAVWVLWGQATPYVAASTNDIEGTATTVVRGTVSGQHAGWSTQLGDDWDGDGDDELWIFGTGTDGTEALLVVEGGTARRAPFDPAAVAVVRYAWDAATPDAEMIRRAGDWDGDGASEMLVFLEDATSAFGRSELFSSQERAGSYAEIDDNAGSLIGAIDADASESNGNVGFGTSPLPGDVDGDGDDDIAVGDPEWQTAKGKAYVLLNENVAGE